VRGILTAYGVLPAHFPPVMRGLDPRTPPAPAIATPSAVSSRRMGCFHRTLPPSCADPIRAPPPAPAIAIPSAVSSRRMGCCRRTFPPSCADPIRAPPPASAVAIPSAVSSRRMGCFRRTFPPSCADPIRAPPPAPAVAIPSAVSSRRMGCFHRTLPPSCADLIRAPPPAPAIAIPSAVSSRRIGSCRHTFPPSCADLIRAPPPAPTFATPSAVSSRCMGCCFPRCSWRRRPPLVRPKVSHRFNVILREGGGPTPYPRKPSTNAAPPVTTESHHRLKQSLTSLQSKNLIQTLSLNVTQTQTPRQSKGHPHPLDAIVSPWQSLLRLSHNFDRQCRGTRSSLGQAKIEHR